MAPNARQRDALERLHSNESLTDNLTDDAARAVLKLAEQRILEGVPGETVFEAVSAANNSGAETPEAALAQVTAALPAAPAPATLPGKRSSNKPKIQSIAEGAVHAAAPSSETRSTEPLPATPSGDDQKRPSTWELVRRWFTGH